MLSGIKSWDFRVVEGQCEAMSTKPFIVVFQYFYNNISQKYLYWDANTRNYIAVNAADQAVQQEKRAEAKEQKDKEQKKKKATKVPAGYKWTCCSSFIAEVRTFCTNGNLHLLFVPLLQVTFLVLLNCGRNFCAW